MYLYTPFLLHTDLHFIGWTEYIETSKDIINSDKQIKSLKKKDSIKRSSSGKSTELYSPGSNKEKSGKWCLFWRLDRFLPSEMESCLPFQRINHFPKSLEITRKVTRRSCREGRGREREGRERGRKRNRERINVN